MLLQILDLFLSYAVMAGALYTMPCIASRLFFIFYLFFLPGGKLYRLHTRARAYTLIYLKLSTIDSKGSTTRLPCILVSCAGAGRKRVFMGILVHLRGNSGGAWPVRACACGSCCYVRVNSSFLLEHTLAFQFINSRLYSSFYVSHVRAHKSW